MHERWEEHDVKESAGNTMTTTTRDDRREKERSAAAAAAEEEEEEEKDEEEDDEEEDDEEEDDEEEDAWRASARSCRSCTSGGMWRQRRKCGRRAATTSPRTKGSRDRGQGRTWAGHNGAWGKP